MRTVIAVLLSLIHLSAEEPAPPSLVLSVGDVPAWSERFSSTWIGRFLTGPATAAERGALLHEVKLLKRDTGIALPITLKEIAALQVALGDDGHQVQSTWWLSGPTTAVLAEVDAAVVRQQQERAEKIEQSRAYWRQHNKTGVYAEFPSLAKRTAVERRGDAVFFCPQSVAGTLHSEMTIDPFSSWTVRISEQQLHLARLPSLVVPTAPLRPLRNGSLTATMAIGQLLSDTGIPLLHGLRQAAGVESTTLTIDADGHDLTEQARLVSKALPFRAVDLNGLPELVPTDCLALTLIGVDGPALATLASQCLASEPAAGLSDALIALLKPMSGTVWLAVVDGQPYPNLVLGLPASPAFDQALITLLGRGPNLVNEAQQRTVAAPGIHGVCEALALRRTATHWLLATHHTALENLGKARALTALPASNGQTIALGWQDNARLIPLIATRASLAWLALKAQGLADGQPQENAVSIRRALVQTLVERVSRWALSLSPAARPSTWVVQRSGDELTWTGRNSLTTAATVPVGLCWWWYGLPLAHPDAALGSPFVSLGRRAAAWSDFATEFYQDFYERLGQEFYPAALAETTCLATHASGPATRSAALWHMMVCLSDNRRAEVLPLVLAACDDPRQAMRTQGLQLIGTLLDLPAADPLALTSAIARGLSHADPFTRQTAAMSVGNRSHFHLQVRQRQRQADKQMPPTQVQIPPPPAQLLAPLLVAVRSERDERVAAAMISTLGGYDSPEVYQCLAELLKSESALVRSHAGSQITSYAAFATDPNATQLVLAQLRDETLVDGANSVADVATYAVLFLSTPDITAALAERFQRLTADHSSVWFQTLTALLCRRGHAPALDEIARFLDLPNASLASESAYANALGACPLKEAELLLLRLLQREADNPTSCHVLLSAVGQRGDLMPDTIAALVSLVTAHDETTRTFARHLLRKKTLNAAQSAAFTAAEQQAITRFGATAFTRDKPLEIDQPQPQEVNDF